MFKCPGQDQRFWKPGDIFEVKCNSCGQKVEFFKDEPKLKCHGCGNLIVNPKINLGCAKWCRYAEQCLETISTKNTDILCNSLISEMKKVFGKDEKRISHALSVLNYAEQILQDEGGEPLVVKAAAILHDIGITQAERKYNSSAGKYQELEGPAIAEEILRRYDIPDTLIKHICKIIANHHSAKNIDTLEFRIVWDADWLVNIPDEYPDSSNEKLKNITDKIFKTNKGHQLATKLFLKTERNSN
jgi:putative nucleotidyltransferase with HDIG domain